MKTITELNENDIKEIIAKHFDIEKYAVNIETKNECKGYGMSEHNEIIIKCYVSK